MYAPRRWLCATSLAALVLILAVPLPAAAQVAASDCERWTVPERRARAANPIPADRADLTRAREIYVRECASCHGETGKNDGTETQNTDMSCARLLTDPELLTLTDGELFWKVREGRESMPNTLDVLRDQDRWLLVHYLRSLVAQTARSQD
jgi:mono/diheme cytochrome c family protein